VSNFKDVLVFMHFIICLSILLISQGEWGHKTDVFGNVCCYSSTKSFRYTISIVSNIELVRVHFCFKLASTMLLRLSRCCMARTYVITEFLNSYFQFLNCCDLGLIVDKSRSLFLFALFKGSLQ